MDRRTDDKSARGLDKKLSAQPLTYRGQSGILWGGQSAKTATGNAAGDPTQRAGSHYKSASPAGNNLNSGETALRTRELSAKVPIEEYNRFKAHVPAWGGPTWFLNTALRDFNDLLDREPSLRERARQMVEKMMKEQPELDNGNIETPPAG